MNEFLMVFKKILIIIYICIGIFVEILMILFSLTALPFIIFDAMFREGNLFRLLNKEYYSSTVDEWIEVYKEIEKRFVGKK